MTALAFPRCVYCGFRARLMRRGAPVCGFHADLPDLDPHYGLAVTLGDEDARRIARKYDRAVGVRP